MKRIFGYLYALRQYLSTDKGAYDFYDAMRACLIILASMAAGMALMIALFG